MAKYDINIKEEELKRKVGNDFFGNFDTTRIICNIDFCVSDTQEDPSLFDMGFHKLAP